MSLQNVFNKAFDGTFDKPKFFVKGRFLFAILK